MNRLVFMVLTALLLAGCSSKSVLMASAASLRFVEENVHVKVDGQNIDQRVLAQLTREIKAQLIIAGFNIDNEAPKSLNFNIQVTEFTPGNAALRMTVGLGAGRGSLVYFAEYTSQGTTLAKMNGEERFTGLEVGFNQNYGGTTTLGGEETATGIYHHIDVKPYGLALVYA